jgi:hypothetical protein
MSSRHLVEFVDQAAVDLPEALQNKLREELDAIFRKPKPLAITVSRCFAGYAGLSADKVILGVEVRRSGGLETHIVKVGAARKVAWDYDGWRKCRRGRDIASRIMLPVQKHALGKGRLAILYQDAYTLYGPNRAETHPEWLETVAQWSVLDDKPDPQSVERALVQIYTDLARWFYYGSEERPGDALRFYQHYLARALQNWSQDTVEAGQHEQARRRWEIRQDAIWLLCTADPPDGKGNPQYLDACDYVTWALTEENVPPTLIGRSHGDLHARNILLAVQRGEAEYPVVIDYGAMATDNVLVWDFVRLETELKNHLLPYLFDDAHARKALTDSDAALPAETRALSAARMNFNFRFEKLLAQRTTLIEGRRDAESRQPPGGRIATGHSKVDRLLSIVLRIRQEAALWLGYQASRQHRWRDEYYFALACYGLAHGQKEWDYEPRQTECSLISAGVAAANVGQARSAIRDMIAEDISRPSYPSFRVPLALAHLRWSKGRIQEATSILKDALAIKVGRPNFRHAVPLLAEHALLLAEQKEHLRAEAMLRPLREGCRLFRDHETLSRVGRAFKESGDKKWEKNPVPFSQLGDLPARQMYRHAFAAYQEAFELTKDPFPGINAATMALLTDQSKVAQSLAHQVLSICAPMTQGLVDEQAIWIFATEGEGSLLIGSELAKDFYASALELVNPGNWQMAQSMYKQLCRLWQALGPDAVDPVIREFEKKAEVWKLMKPGPIGDCGGRRLAGRRKSGHRKNGPGKNKQVTEKPA